MKRFIRNMVGRKRVYGPGNKAGKKAYKKSKTSGVYIPRGSPATLTTVLPLRNAYKTTLKYVSYGSLDAGAGLASTLVFSANSLFDPDVTGAGHQPRGYDQLATMYEYYLVNKATAYVQFVAGPTATGQPMTVCLSLSDQSAPYSSSIYDYTEQPSAVYKLMSGDASGTASLKLAVNPPKYNNYDQEDGAVKASIAGSPGAQVYFHLSQMSTDLAAENPGPVSFIMTIVYEATFSAVKMPSVS